METTLYMVKPHGMMFCGEIREIIEKSGLVIVESKRLVLPRWALKRIYSDLPEELWNAMCSPFTSALVEIGLISGEEAIKIFFHLAGTQPDPVDCDPESIRFKFGRKEPFVIDGINCYTNVIHRPKNQEEATKNIEVFRAL